MCIRDSPVKVFFDNVGTRQLAVERITCRTDHESFRNDSGIITRGQPSTGFFDEQLFLWSKLDYFCETLVTQSFIRLVTNRINDQFDSLAGGIENARRDRARARVRMTARPKAATLLRLVLKTHASQQLEADEGAQVGSRMRPARTIRLNGSRCTSCLLYTSDAADERS